MVRDVAILGAAMMAIQIACPHAYGAPVTETDIHRARHKAIASLHTTTVHKVSVRRQVTRAADEMEPADEAVQIVHA